MANYGIVPGQVSLQNPTQGGGFDWLDFMKKKYQPGQGIDPNSLKLDTSITNPGTANDVSSLTGIAAGAGAGGATGATLGSVVGPWGTAIGGALGAIAGGIGGGINGSDQESAAKVAAAQAENERMDKLRQWQLSNQLAQSQLANQGMGNFLQFQNQAEANGRLNNFRAGLHAALAGGK